jgi:hypothetical protein
MMFGGIDLQKQQQDALAHLELPIEAARAM